MIFDYVKCFGDIVYGVGFFEKYWVLGLWVYSFEGFDKL